MAKLKIEQLEGYVLDYAVAMAENFLGIGKAKPDHGYYEIYDIGTDEPFRPSQKASQGYYIILENDIGTSKFGDSWCANNNTKWKGDTPLIAAMKYHVENKLGPEVEIPDDIIVLKKTSGLKMK